MRLGSLQLAKPLALALCLGALIPEALIPNGALALFATTLLALLLSADARAAIWRWSPDGHAGREAMIGVVAGVGIALLSDQLIDPVIRAVTGYTPDLSNFASLEGNLANTLVMLVIGWVIGGLFEEISHRGLVIGWGTRLLGERAQVPLLLLVSVVFGLAHLYQGVGGAISTGLVGLLFGIIYLYRDRTLLAAVIAHGTVDTIGIVNLYLG